MAKQPTITVKVINGTEEFADRIRVWSTGFLSETRVVNPDIELDQQVLELAYGFATVTGLKVPKEMYPISDGEYNSIKPKKKKGEGDE
jgi:type IV secretory pathway TrbF-like protein